MAASGQHRSDPSTERLTVGGRQDEPGLAGKPTRCRPWPVRPRIRAVRQCRRYRRLWSTTMNRDLDGFRHSRCDQLGGRGP